ncbi:MAG: hypothetical protein COB46_09025 [Rhodospirillaceae bacterium]|nr:MAG: hypothetical protein COB46_09025 [Rhodospirillaceae bacterium]
MTDTFDGHTSDYNRLKILEFALNTSSQGFVVWDQDQKLVAWSQKCFEFWYQPADLIRPGLPMAELILHIAKKGAFGKGDPQRLADLEFGRVLKAGKDSREEFTMLDGRIVHVQRHAMQDGGHASTYTDITERKQLEDEINHLATHDTLTNIPNRVLLMDRLELALARADREKTKVAVLFLDLDNFKPVNDIMGHMIGDQILRKMADRMVSCLRKTDTVARFGGDEFAIVMTDVVKTIDVTHMAENLNKILVAPINLGSKEATLGASIGIALYPDNAKTAATLLSLADEAMYVVKHKGKQGFHFTQTKN